ncbi:caspase, EACC1-associated type [Saccharothrix variisporea]|uniref:WD-40 repeat-containing protein n=1 Tax=Saccharothrix variisporea TaxID=543527 RepID=A0A495XL66_9PSEU|nr:caspase family protein [Saccharothrix variisporea]RKT74847.1 WD-40 repeat-containing protein [Saccharothrix variisporea]
MDTDPPALLGAAGARVVVVATSRHVGGSLLPDVPSAATTARDLARVYVDRCGLAEGDLTVVLDPAGPRELAERLLAVAEEATDVLVVHFVGHGLVGPDDSLHLATFATDDPAKGLAHHRALRYAELKDVVAHSPARSVLLVLDCCFAGRAAGLDPVRRSLADSARDGVYQLASAGADEAAWAPEGSPHTAFSGELVRLLDEGVPGGPRVLTLDDVFEELSARLGDRGYPRPLRFATGHAARWRLAPNPAWRPGGGTGAPPHPGRAPYRGLAYFRREDADFFFGRDELSRGLVGRLGEAEPLLVLGPSGAGKSSVLRAGLAAAVDRVDGWTCHVVTPGADPFAPLAAWLADRGRGSVAELRAALRSDPDALAVRLRATPAGDGTRASREHVVLVVDQVEELFTAVADEDVRSAYVRALVGVARGRAASVVLGVRAGYFGHCARYPELLPALGRPAVVAPLGQEQLREVIVEPARKAGLELEPGLVERLLTDLGDGPGSLPLLSHALLKTWEERDGGRLTLAGYQRTGGIQGAVARTADAVYDSLEPDSRDVARRLLLRLVSIGDTGDLRRVVPQSELALDERGQRVLDAFVRARLVNVDQDAVAIAHEALLRAWPRLRDWIAADRAGLLVRQQLAESARNWQRHDRDPELLYRGNRLAEVSAWQGERQQRDPVGEVEADFLAASRRRRRVESRRRRAAVAVLAVMLVLAASAAVYATVQQRESARLRAAAEASGDTALSLLIARTAGDVRDLNPVLAMQLGVAAYRTAPTTDARSALLSAVTIPAPAVVSGHENAVDGLAFDRENGVLVTASEDTKAKLWDVETDPRHPRWLGDMDRHTGYVFDVAVSPRGGRAVTGSNDRTAKLWDISNPRAPKEIGTMRDHTDAVRGVAFSPDGAYVATASVDGTAKLWDVRDTSHPVGEMKGHEGAVRGVSFHPDGRTVSTTGVDKSVKLWDITDPAHPALRSTVTEHADTVRMAPFSPDGKLMVSASNDRTAKLWDVTDAAAPRVRATLSGHADTVRNVAFTPDGTVVATVSVDKTTRLWDIHDPDRPQPLLTLGGHGSIVNAVAFARDGRTLATGSADSTVKLWDVGDPSHPASLLPALSGHRGPVRGVTFSPDRRTLVTTADDGTARVWDLSPPGRPRAVAELTGHTRSVTAAVFNPTGRLLVTCSDDGTFRLWDVTDRAKPELLAVQRASDNTLKGAVFSGDGTVLVTASGDRTARLWDVRYPRQVTALSSLLGHDSYLYAVAASPDGRTVATGSEDRTVKLWDVTDPRRPVLRSTVTGHTATVWSVAFSPDGTTLATASADRTVRLADVRDPAKPVPRHTLEGHFAPVYAVAFGPDGRVLATGADDGTAKVWDVSGEPRVTATLVGHGGPVSAVALGDGVLATGSWDRTAQLWLTNVDEVAALVCDRVGAKLADQEWSQVLPDIPRRPACAE